MNFFKILFLKVGFVLFFLISSSLFADSHDTKKVSKEEPLPLNDPFVGDGSLSGGNSIKLIAGSEEEKRNLSVFNYKLVGVIEGNENMFASMIDENGEILTLNLFEELSPGVRLISLDSKEIVFERENEDSLVVINFKNQIIERDK